MAPGGLRKRVVTQSEVGKSSEAAHVPSADAGAHGKKTRGKALNKKLNDYVRRSKEKVKIELPVTKWKPICEDGNELAREVGIVCRANIPLLDEDQEVISDWRKVPKDAKDHMHNLLKEKFDFVGDPEHITKALNRMLQERFKDFRSKMREHYEKYKDVNEAKAHPCNEIDMDAWAKICDRYASAKFQNISATNKASRQQLKTPHSGGSMSFVRRREILREKLTPSQDSYSMVDFYKTTHYSTKKGRWLSENAHALHNQMDTLRKEAQPADGSTETQKPSDDEIAFEILKGTCRGYVLGLGHGEVAPPSSSSSKITQSQFDQANRRAEMAEQSAAEAHELLAEYRERFEQQQSNIDKLLEFMRQQQDAPPS